MTNAEIIRHAAEGVDVIMRFHDISRLWELERAAFSLAGQLHKPVRILVATQRFTPEAKEAVRTAIETVVAWSPSVSVSVLNFSEATPIDARSELINLGFANVSGRYLGFLDYDDVLYPEAYAFLVGRLRASDAGIAFARTQVVLADVHGEFSNSLKHLQPFVGDSLADLFRSNFCPIHSYMLDRTRIPASLLRFEPTLVIEEDYDFLLRVVAAVPSDFHLHATDIGLYYYKTDGSNTFERGAKLPPEVIEREATARAFVELRRKMTSISACVQQTLGIWPARPQMTIRSFLSLRAEGVL